MTKRQMAIILWLLGVVQFGEFRLKAHRTKEWAEMALSPFFINLRTQEDGGPLIPEQARFIGEQLGLWYRVASHPDDCLPEFVLGIPRAGTPLALGFYEAFAEDGISLLAMHKEGSKESQIQTQIEGKFSARDFGLAIDDVISDGASKIEIAAIMAAHDLEVDFVVAVDRGGAGKLRLAGYSIEAMFDLEELMDIYLEAGIVGREQYDQIMAYDAYTVAYKASHPVEAEA